MAITTANKLTSHNVHSVKIHPILDIDYTLGTIEYGAPTPWLGAENATLVPTATATNVQGDGVSRGQIKGASGNTLELTFNAFDYDVAQSMGIVMKDANNANVYIGVAKPVGVSYKVQEAYDDGTELERVIFVHNVTFSSPEMTNAQDPQGEAALSPWTVSGTGAPYPKKFGGYTYSYLDLEQNDYIGDWNTVDNEIYIPSTVATADTIPPVITGDSAKSFALLATFDIDNPQTWPSFTIDATDNIDGNVTNAIKVKSNVNNLIGDGTDLAGDYDLVYTVFDNAGNESLPHNVIVTIA